MYNRQFIDRGHDQIEAQILRMPRQYVSLDFCDDFGTNYPDLYEQFIRIYTARHHDRPHAI